MNCILKSKIRKRLCLEEAENNIPVIGVHIIKVYIIWVHFTGSGLKYKITFKAQRRALFFIQISIKDQSVDFGVIEGLSENMCKGF